MKIVQNFNLRVSDQRGAVAVIIAIVLSMLIGFVALAVDVGYLMVAKNELQNIADSAALAGARTLGRLYECNGSLNACNQMMPYEDQLTYDADVGAIRQAAINVASLNQAGGQSSIIINSGDIVIGLWDSGSDPKTINPVTNIAPDAVRVTARMDTDANNPITTFFAGIFGINTVNVSADATAALTSLSNIGPGLLPIPVAINSSWMDTLPCNQDLTFHPSSAGVCAAWNVYDGSDPRYKNPSASRMQELVEVITAENFTSPETIANETEYLITNGTLASLFTSEAMQNLFNTMKVKDDGNLDNDVDPTTWTTSVAVYDDSTAGCNPTGAVSIVGFASITITAVSPPPETTIYATVICDLVEGGRGVGDGYGPKGSIPGLVE
jgi:hypothetical protein